MATQTKLKPSLLTRLRHLGYSAKYIAIPPDDGKPRKWELREMKKKALTLLAKAKQNNGKTSSGTAEMIAEKTGLSISTVHKLSMSHPRVGKEDPLTLLFEDCIREIYETYPKLRGKHIYVSAEAQAVRPDQIVVSTKEKVRELLSRGMPATEIATSVGTGRAYIYQIRKELQKTRK